LQGHSLDFLNQPEAEEDGRVTYHLAHLTIVHPRSCKDANHQITHQTTQSLGHQVSFMSSHNDRNGLQRPIFARGAINHLCIPKHHAQSLIYKNAMDVLKPSKQAIFQFFS
jgi:hypothetical protein